MNLLYKFKTVHRFFVPQNTVFHPVKDGQLNCKNYYFFFGCIFVKKKRDGPH